MNKYTVFFEQVNRINFQVKASTLDKAAEKAEILYRRQLETPEVYVQVGWLVEADGEDK